jgi:hypothetical protein
VSGQSKLVQNQWEYNLKNKIFEPSRAYALVGHISLKILQKFSIMEKGFFNTLLEVELDAKNFLSFGVN